MIILKNDWFRVTALPNNTSKYYRDSSKIAICRAFTSHVSQTGCFQCKMCPQTTNSVATATKIDWCRDLTIIYVPAKNNGDRVRIAACSAFTSHVSQTGCFQCKMCPQTTNSVATATKIDWCRDLTIIYVPAKNNGDRVRIAACSAFTRKSLRTRTTKPNP